MRSPAVLLLLAAACSDTSQALHASARARIGLFGSSGANGASDFNAWLTMNGVSVTRVQTDTATLTPALLSRFDIVIVDQLVRDYAPAEAALFARWIEGGGGAVSMTGYTG